MNTSKTIALFPLASVSALLPDAELVSFDVGPDKTVYLSGALNPLDYRTTGKSGATFAKTVPDSPQRYRIVGFNYDETLFDVTIEDAGFNLHHVQKVGKELLLVCSRSIRRSATDIERNGHFYTFDGKPTRSVLLGDGILSTQATGKGTLWTSYFDEGVFGNYGWNDPIGSPGLIEWDNQGNGLYKYTPLGSDVILDCYALNVASDTETWCYYYTAFPLVLIRHKKAVAQWSMPLRGSHAFAVSFPHVLFQGGYNDQDTYYLYKLNDNGSVTPHAEITLTNQDGEKLVAGLAVGRGDTLFLLADDWLYSLDLWQAFQA